MPSNDKNWKLDKKRNVLTPPTNDRFKRKAKEAQTEGSKKTLFENKGEKFSQGMYTYLKALSDKEANKTLTKYMNKLNRGMK